MLLALVVGGKEWRAAVARRRLYSCSSGVPIGVPSQYTYIEINSNYSQVGGGGKNQVQLQTQGCGSGSELDPDSIGSVDPDPFRNPDHPQK
jgi:hypothetical protein